MQERSLAQRMTCLPEALAMAKSVLFAMHHITLKPLLLKRHYGTMNLQQ